MASHDRFRVVGGTSLRGEVSVTGAKNSVLKLMAASLLAAGTTTIRNVPDIADVEIMADLLTRLGCTVVRGADTVTITVPQEPAHRADYDLVRKMRIVDLGEFLISMGAKIEGLGSPLITITGVEVLNPTDHTTITDRIILPIYFRW
jgi:UDP-N-acetylglucosamine enolpyruvyl transferase